MARGSSRSASGVEEAEALRACLVRDRCQCDQRWRPCCFDRRSCRNDRSGRKLVADGPTRAAGIVRSLAVNTGSLSWHGIPFLALAGAAGIVCLLLVLMKATDAQSSSEVVRRLLAPPGALGR